MFQCAKLPNPIDRILDKQAVLSGDTFDSVIMFLKLLVQVRIHAQVLGIPDVQVLLILYPYTVGVLATRLSEAVSSRVSLDHFHLDTLRFLLLPRARASLQQKYCYRVQADGELLPNYVADIRAYVNVFCLDSSEGEVVQTILDGLSPVCRSYLVFAGFLVRARSQYPICG
jgi:hypothetical protein